MFVKVDGGLTEQADDPQLSSAVTGESMTFTVQAGQCELLVELRRDCSANAC